MEKVYVPLIGLQIYTFVFYPQEKNSTQEPARINFFQETRKNGSNGWTDEPRNQREQRHEHHCLARTARATRTGEQGEDETSRSSALIKLNPGYECG